MTPSRGIVFAFYHIGQQHPIIRYIGYVISGNNIQLNDISDIIHRGIVLHPIGDQYPIVAYRGVVLGSDSYLLLRLASIAACDQDLLNIKS